MIRKKRPGFYGRSNKYRLMGVPSGINPNRKAYLRYCEQVNMTSTSGGLQTWVFSANGVYDPNISGSGHQPMGYDTWATLFNHYVVRGSKINVQVTSNGTVPNPAYFGLYLTDDSSAPYTSYSEFIEAKRGMYKLLPQDSNRAIYLSNKFSAKRFFNVTDIKDNLDRLGSDVTANPSEQAYFMLWVQTTNATTQAVNAVVTIDYIVEYSEPKDLSQS